MKKALSILLSIVMLFSVASITSVTFAGDINTAATANQIGVGVTAQTFKYGYPSGKGSDYVSETGVYFKFVAPTSDYYEFSVTGYENTVYEQGKNPSVDVSISDVNGKHVRSGSFNEFTRITKCAAQLTAGQTYFIELSNYLSGAAVFSTNDYGYIEQTLFLNIGVHEHEFDTEVTNYSDGSYTTSYDCRYCDYFTSVNTPAPNSGQSSTISSWDSNGYTTDNVFTPTKTKLTKATGKKKAVALKWARATNVGGYEIQVATDKKFKKNKKTVKVNKQTTTSKTISGLKAKKKYYSRIRTYVVVNGKKVYSGWSAVKSFKTK